jgi:hypothetical protein
MEILNRVDAIAIGSYKYFTGKPCKHGHVAERYTKTCVCVECHKGANAKTMARLTLAMQGVRPFSVKCHPHDWPAIEQFAWQLAAARGIHLAPPAPAKAAPPDPTPTDSILQRWQMWSRVHGETIARQMFAQEGLTPPSDER